MNRSVITAAPVYLAALFQGLTLVSFPASSDVLRQAHGFSDAQYGAIFLPQVAVAFVSSMLTAALMFGSGTASFMVGGLRTSLSLEELYRVSAIYPAIVLGLIAVTVRLIHSKQWAPA